jgi:hypothetical protein
MTKSKDIIHELKHHLPFTLFATGIGIIIIIILNFILKLSIDKEAFEILHPLHVIVSAVASAGIFYKYKKNFALSVIVGVISAIVIGSVSDVILPFLGAKILFLEPEFHLPIIEETLLILGAATVGSIIGILTKATKTSHTLHVLLSVFASLFYLTAFTTGIGIIHLLISIIIVAIAVVIPCCVSDIVFPFFFLKKKIKTCSCKNKENS